MLKQINADVFENETKEGITLVDFFATWCGPCQMLMPIIDELSEEITDVNFVKLDVDEPANKKLAMGFKVMSIPTLVLMKDGEEVAKNVGALSKEDLVKFIDQAR